MPMTSLSTSVKKLTIMCRVWALVWGGILTCTMTLVPTFRHFRILNIISLAGTAYTAVYLIAQSGDLTIFCSG